MKHNSGYASLKEPKRMNHRINVPWVVRCILTLMYAGVIYWESSRDTSSIPLPYHTDKLVHGAEFGLLCLMACWSLSSAGIGGKAIYKIILPIVLTSIYGATDEFHQSFTPHRSVDVFDWVADTAGAVAAGFFWQTITQKLQTKEKVLAIEKSPINM